MELIKRFEGHDFEPGTVVIREGDVGQGLFVILLGEVEIVHKDPTGREKAVAKLGAGEMFGEMSLLGDRPTTATVRTLSPRRAILFLGRDYFRRLVERAARRCASTSRSCRSTAAARACRASTVLALRAARHFRRPARLPRRHDGSSPDPLVESFRARRASCSLPGAGAGRTASGGSFGGRMGFRSGGGVQQRAAQLFGRRPQLLDGGGTHFFFLPGLGWGGDGLRRRRSLFGTLFVLGAVGIGAAMVMRAVRRSRSQGDGGVSGYGDARRRRSGRGAGPRVPLQAAARARAFGARRSRTGCPSSPRKGDTSSEAGLASLLQQSALELLRNKDSVRYAAAEARGPMSLTNAETAMNGVSLAERSRFQVERMRAADGRAARSEAPAEEGKEALELVVVTLVAATRTPLERFRPVGTPTSWRRCCPSWAASRRRACWAWRWSGRPADANDSMTETDVMTTYPELRSL